MASNEALLPIPATRPPDVQSKSSWPCMQLNRQLLYWFENRSFAKISKLTTSLSKDWGILTKSDTQSGGAKENCIYHRWWRVLSYTIVDVFDNYLVNHVIDKLLLTLRNSIYTFPYRLTQCTHSTLLSNSISVKYDVGTSGAQLTAPKRMSMCPQRNTKSDHKNINI